MDRFAKSDQIVMLLGAFAAVLWIKQEPDGNLLVTSVCALIGGSVSLGIWRLIKGFLRSR
jgi:ABC-type uncharacterized transport system permease subunit